MNTSSASAKGYSVLVISDGEKLRCYVINYFDNANHMELQTNLMPILLWIDGNIYIYIHIIYNPRIPM